MESEKPGVLAGLLRPQSVLARLEGFAGDRERTGGGDLRRLILAKPPDHADRGDGENILAFKGRPVDARAAIVDRDFLPLDSDFRGLPFAAHLRASRDGDAEHDQTEDDLVELHADSFNR